VNSDISTAIQSTADGGSIIAGSTLSFGSGGDDGFALKMDAAGNVQWFNVFGGSGGDDINSVQQTADGGYILVGQTNSFGATQLDVWSVKLNANGSVAWSKFYRLPGNDYGMSVRQIDDGSYIICGYTDSFGAGNGDVLLIKIDVTGNIQWAKVYGGPWNDYGSCVRAFHGQAGYVVAGYSYSNPATQSADILLMSVNGDGTLNWAKFYGGDGDDIVHDIEFTSDNGFVVTGMTKSFGLSSGDAYTFSTDGSGNINWSKTIGGNTLDEAFSVIENSDGEFTVTGKTNSFGAGNNDLFVFQLDNLGGYKWMKVFGGANDDLGTGIVQRSDGNYVVSGITASIGAGNNDVYVLNIKNDGTGCLANNGIMPTGGDPSTTETDAAAILLTNIGTYENDDAPVILNPINVTVTSQCNNP
jgi:hypothetical protein